jgi:small subunit ribosomal protein S8
MTDPIADMLTRIRNAQMVRKESVSLPYSKMKEHIAKILKDEGYVSEMKKTEETGRKEIRITLKYVAKQPAIRELKRVSTPGRRVYAGKGKLPFVYDNLGIAIISTSKGVMTNREARKQKVGGEVLCEIF